jgi:hypothetical protein
MRKPLLILLLASITVIAACAQSRKAGSKKTTVASKTPAALKGLSSVTLRRSACFGRCPEYIATIHSDGLAEYAGSRYATPLGVYKKNIGAAEAQKLLKSFMAHRADTCSELYESRIADLPGLHYILTINGKKKIINNANFGPPYLLELGEEMDALFHVDNTWTKISDKVEGNE